MDLPVRGDQPAAGREWGGHFRYAYAGGAVECRYYDTPFRIAGGMVHIGGEAIALDPGLQILFDPQTKKIIKCPLAGIKTTKP